MGELFGSPKNSMSDILDEIRLDSAARKKLERIAKGETEQLTKEGAERLVKALKWLHDERESLIRSIS